MNQKEKNKKLVGGITTVFLANVLGTFFNVALNFLLPKYLTFEAYAGIKTYELYYSFVSTATIGFIDGVYLEYGGMVLTAIRKEDISIRINTLRWFELVIMVSLIPVSYLLKDNVFFYFALSVPALNIIGLFQLLYQATGEYSRYSKILNVTTISKTIISIALLFFVTRDNYEIYLWAYVIMDFGIALWQEIAIRVNNIGWHSIFACSYKLLIQEIKDGFVLRVGVLSGFLLSGMDRLFVKLLMSTTPFALYSFAATVENLLNVMITPVTTTMYNYFCNKPSAQQIKKIRNVIVIASLGTLLIFYPVKLFLSIYIKNYTEALTVLAFLFASKSLYMVVQGIYVNLYKARRKQNKYLLKLLLIIAVGFVSNYVFYQVDHVKESFAIATLVTSIIWLILSTMDFKDISFTIKDVIYYSLGLIIFMLSACRINVVLGMIIYLCYLILSTKLLMPEELHVLFSYIREYIDTKRSKGKSGFNH